VSVLSKQLTLPKLPHMPSVKLPTRSRRSASVTGLDIGATEVIAAEASLVGGRIVADRVVSRPMPLGLMHDGLVVDPDLVAEQLRELFAEHRLGKRVRVGLATPRTVLRVIDLPPLPDKDIRAALMMVAPERIPMPLDRAVMDYRTVGIVDTPEGRRLRVIVVVTEKEGVDRLLDALGRAGLKPEGIDLSIFAVVRALGRVEETQGAVLYAQLGDLVNLAIAEAGVCRFTRQAPQGLEMVLGRLAELRAIPTDEAQEVLRSALPGADTEGAALDRDLAALLSRTASELGSELRAAGEFYSTQAGNAVVTAGVITGPLAPLPGFLDALAEASGLNLTFGEVATASADALNGVDPRLAPVASGLAVAEII
jgi:type IV pilus assembly protein PilM